MRCKICSKVVRSNACKKRHCWQSNQQCTRCHYLGVMDMTRVKYAEKDLLTMSADE